LIEHSAFIEPHKIWFDRATLLTKDKSFSKWKGHKEYFIGVNQAMEKIMPEASKEERTEQARNWYQEDVEYYISIHPEVINNKLKKILKELKEKFTLALITTNTEEHILKILKTTKLEDIYDIIFASKAKEEPNKEKIFQDFKEKYGEPKYYLASRSEEAFEACKKIGVTSIYFSPKPKSEIKKIVNFTIEKEEDLINLIIR
jgi:FMN phosphatase YigB (HAD superfamily)